MRMLIIVIVAPLCSGCFGTHYIPFTDTAETLNATGVTLRSGEEIEFMATGATISNDTLYAVTRHDHIAIPTDSITRISVRRFSPLRTGGLVIGFGVAAFFSLVAAIAHGLGTIN